MKRNLQNIYLSGVELECEKQLMAVINHLMKDDEVKILNMPDYVNVVEMRATGRWGEREKTGETHLGLYWKYITFEYKGVIFYIQIETFRSGLEITPYIKQDNFKKRQADYPTMFWKINEMYVIMNAYVNERLRGVSGTSSGSYLYSEIDAIKKEAGNREMSVLNNLKEFYLKEHTAEHKVYKFVDYDGDSFDWDEYTNKITG